MISALFHACGAGPHFRFSKLPSRGKQLICKRWRYYINIRKGTNGAKFFVTFFEPCEYKLVCSPPGIEQQRHRQIWVIFMLVSRISCRRGLRANVCKKDSTVLPLRGLGRCTTVVETANFVFRVISCFNVTITI